MQSKILIVDDNPDMIRLMGRILSSMGQLRFATSAPAALHLARELVPDLILLDTEMPGMNGYEMCEALKADSALCEVPVIFVTAHSGVEFELRGLEIGAVDFIGKPISEPLLVARVKTHLRIKQLTDELKRIATIDALTEVSTRRSFDTALLKEWQRSQRNGEPISLLLVDVDHFKRFNDHYGHPAGDACLRNVAMALRSSVLRPTDLVARYGGEEFALLLPDTPRAGAQRVAQRVLEAVNDMAMPHDASPTATHVTVSVGICCNDNPGLSALHSDSACHALRIYETTDLLKGADQALYAAKHAGRAQIWMLDIADMTTPERACAVNLPQSPRIGRAS
jgi:diguanylate cyclase (GGDEF)-like protein